MAPGGSVTHWFKGLEGGDSAPASAIWHRYYPELVRLARDNLRGVPRGMADEEQKKRKKRWKRCQEPFPETVPDTFVDAQPLIGMALTHGYELRVHVKPGGVVTIGAVP